MTYAHTQRGRFAWLLLAIALVTLALLPVVEGMAAKAGLAVFAAAFVFVAAAFWNLTVREEGAHLVVAFGPLSIAQRRIAYDDIASARAARSRFIDGWGMHWSPSRGWIWNIDGRDCVELELRSGTFRIGTDDPTGLVKHIEARARGTRAE